MTQQSLSKLLYGPRLHLHDNGWCVVDTRCLETKIKHHVEQTEYCVRVQCVNKAIKELRQ